MDRSRPDDVEFCEYCETEISKNQWHPVLATTEAGDEFNLLSFCSDECKNAWTREHGDV